MQKEKFTIKAGGMAFNRILLSKRSIQSGFSVAIIVLIVAGIVLTSGIGLYIYKSYFSVFLDAKPVGHVLTTTEFASFPESLMSSSEALQYIPNSLPFDDTSVLGKSGRFNENDISPSDYGLFGYEDWHSDVSPYSKQPPKNISQRSLMFIIVNDNSSSVDSNYFLDQLKKGCTDKPDLGVGDGPSCIDDTIDLIDTRYLMSIKPTTFNELSQLPGAQPQPPLIFRVGNFFLGLNECGYVDVNNGSPSSPVYCSEGQMIATAQLFACRFSAFINNQSTTTSSCGTSPTTSPPKKLPPSDLAVHISPADGMVKLTWQDNENYSGIQIERAVQKDFSDWSNIESGQGNMNSYVDSLNDSKGKPLQLPEDNEGYRVRAVYSDGTYSTYSNVAELNNCVDLSPSPAMNDIVIRREDNVTYSLKDIFTQMNSTIDNYFAQVDPYKSYFSTFSFKFDLKQLKHNDLSYSGSMVSFDSGPIVRSTSSCKENTRTFISLLDNPGLYYAWTDILSGPSSYIYMNIGSNFTAGNNIKYANSNVHSFSNTILHEMGHALGSLNDEYTTKGDWLSSITSIYDRENCAINPSFAFKSSIDGLLYGSPASKSTLGCGVAKSSLIGVYRPAPTSIMEDNLNTTNNPADTKFNVISCGYLVSGILLEPLDKAHAETHWPACMKMDTVKDGIPTTTLKAYQQ